MSLYVGLDIGGTKLMVASAGRDGKILMRAQEPTPSDLQEGIDLLNEMIVSVIDGQKPAAIGVAIGGPLDYKQGVVAPIENVIRARRNGLAGFPVGVAAVIGA